MEVSVQIFEGQLPHESLGTYTKWC